MLCRPAADAVMPAWRAVSEVTPFLDLRSELTAHRLGSGGRAVCEALSDAMDEVLGRLAVGTPGLAVVAVGGYGRREMCLQSDVDVMLLHGGRLTDGTVREVLYPLWDAKLAVGHSVRTVKEALAAAADDIATLTALLDARLVAGEATLVDDLLTKLGQRLRKGKLDVAEPLGRQEQERREAEPFPVQEVDVKLGRGGLRSLHTRHWRSRAAEMAGGEAEPPQAAEQAAADVLLATRNGLHAVTGRGENRFAFGLRPAVAAWLGTSTDEAARRLYLAVRTVDTPDPAAPPPGPVAEQLPALLRAGAAGWDRFEALRAAGRLDEELPEWAHVVAAPQAVPFHAHPVDAHLWRAVAELVAITAPASSETWAPEVAADLGDLDDVLLAALFHDIGKGLGGDHAELGAELAGAACARLGLPPDRAARIAQVARLHLLLPDTATRRDVDDPVVVAQTADAVGDLDTLRRLFLVTVADARATGPGMWTEWKASLVRTLFARTAAELARRDAETGPTTDRSRRLAELEVAALPDFDRATVRAHVRGMPAEYPDTFAVGEILRHLELLADLPAGDAISLDARSDGRFTVLTVVGRDRPGLLAAVAGALAIHNVSVLDARLFTRADGWVLDTFRVEHALDAPSARSEWAAVEADVTAAIAGHLDLGPRVAAKAKAYGRGRAAVPVRVEWDTNAAPLDTVLEIHCADEVGRLHRIARALHDLGLDVRLAKIDTRGHEVVDTFFVRHRDGTQVRDSRELAAATATLEAALEPDLPAVARSAGSLGTDLGATGNTKVTAPPCT